MKKLPDILVISISPLHRDPRVLRQLRFLQDRAKLTAAGLTDPGLAGVDFVKLDWRPQGWWTPSVLVWRAQRLGRRVRKRLAPTAEHGESQYWDLAEVRAASERLSGLQADLIIANDIKALPLAIRLAERCGAKVLIDAHEWTPGDYDGDPRWTRQFGGLWDTVCRKYLPRADAMITVCEGIAELYTECYGVPCGVVTNAPFYQDLTWREPAAQTVRVVYHGLVHPQRGSHNMIHLMELLDERFELDLMIAGPETKYVRKFRKLAGQTRCVRLRDPVPMEKIAESTNGYDLGLFLLDPRSTSYRLALPNKFFEYIQARLGIAIWPSPEMKRLVERHGLGLVADDFTLKSMAEKLNSLTRDEIVRFKRNSDAVAGQLCAETNRDHFLQLVTQLTG